MRKLPPEIAENSFYKGGSADKPKAYPFKNTLRLKVSQMRYLIYNKYGL